MNSEKVLTPFTENKTEPLKLKKVAVVGSRTFTDAQLLEKVLDNFKEPFILISGGAKGVDTLAEAYADKKCYDKLIIKPDYKSFGKLAPVIRNTEIIDRADHVILLWDGKSKGTLDVLNKCKKKAKSFSLIEFNHISNDVLKK